MRLIASFASELGIGLIVIGFAITAVWRSGSKRALLFIGCIISLACAPVLATALLALLFAGAGNPGEVWNYVHVQNASGETVYLFEEPFRWRGDFDTPEEAPDPRLLTAHYEMVEPGDTGIFGLNGWGCIEPGTARPALVVARSANRQPDGSGQLQHQETIALEDRVVRYEWPTDYCNPDGVELEHVSWTGETLVPRDPRSPGEIWLLLAGFGGLALLVPPVAGAIADHIRAKRKDQNHLVE